MTQLQRWILWILRQSHRWERLAGRVLGAKRYQAIKNGAWQLYLRDSLRRTSRLRDDQPSKPPNRQQAP